MKQATLKKAFPLLAAAGLLVAGPINAATRTWDGSAGTNWNTPANWSGGGAPLWGDSVVFPSGAANRTNYNDLGNGFRLGNIAVAASYVFAGSATVLTNGITVSSGISGINRATFRNRLNLAGTQTFSAGASLFSSRLELEDVVNSGPLNIDGGGTIEFSSNLVSTGSILMSGGGTLLFSGAAKSVAEIELHSGTILVNALLSNAAIVGQAASGTLGGTGSVASVSFGGTLKPASDAVGVFTCTSNAILANLQPPTTTPATLLVQLNGTNAGTDYDQLRVHGNVGLLGTTFGTARLRVDVGYSAQMGDAFTIIDNRGTNAVEGNFSDFPPAEGEVLEGSFLCDTGHTFQVTYAGGDGNDVVLTKVPVSIWREHASYPWNPTRVFSHAPNWRSDVAPAASDHLIINKSDTAVVGIENDLPAGTLFRSIRFDTRGQITMFGNPVTITGGVTNTGVPADDNYVEFWLPITASTNLHLNTEDTWPGGVTDLDLHESISGAAKVVISGPGQVGFYRTNYYSGDTEVRSGALQTYSSHSIPGSIIVGGGGLPAEVRLGGRPFAAPSSASITINQLGTCRVFANSLQFSNLTFVGGECRVSGNPASVIPTTLISLTALTSGRITGEGRLDLGGVIRDITVADGFPTHDLIIESVITNGTLRKLGLGTLTLAATNTFTGGSIVEAGRLLMNGLTPFGNVTVNGGVLGGIGTCGPVVANGGTVAPGDGVGRLTVFGNLHLNAASTFYVELNGTTPGVSYGQLALSGTANLTGTTLAGEVNYNSLLGHSFVIITNTGSSLVQGTFAGLPQNAQFKLGGKWFTISYTGGNGNDVVLTRVAGPPTVTDPQILANGNFIFAGLADPGVTYTIQANTNLATTNWLNIGTVPADGAGLLQFVDPAAPQHPQRFYRLRQP